MADLREIVGMWEEQAAEVADVTFQSNAIRLRHHLRTGYCVMKHFVSGLGSEVQARMGLR